MSQTQSTLHKIYFGVPRLFGKVFRATKIPSIIILLDLIGLPILLTVLTATRIIPLTAMPIGLYQLRSPDKRGNPPAALLQEMARMTPEQLDRCKTVAEVILFSSLITVFAVFCWIFLFLRFLSQRYSMRDSNHRL